MPFRWIDPGDWKESVGELIGDCWLIDMGSYPTLFLSPVPRSRGGVILRLVD